MKVLLNKETKKQTKKQTNKQNTIKQTKQTSEQTNTQTSKPISLLGKVHSTCADCCSRLLVVYTQRLHYHRSKPGKQTPAELHRARKPSTQSKTKQATQAKEANEKANTVKHYGTNGHWQSSKQNLASDTHSVYEL